MFREADKYWGRDYYRRVPYRVVMINPEVERYLGVAYGDTKKFLDQIAACVSVKRNGEVGYSHPTGGRVRAIELPTPFVDRATGEKCVEADVKGVLFTSSGFEGFRHKLTPGQERREMCVENGREDYVYGPVNLKESTGDFETVMHLRHDGFQTHVPGVVLELSKLVYKGELIDPAEVRRMFGMPENYRFGLYVRFFPGSTSTRVADFVRSIDLPSVVDVNCYEQAIAEGLVGYEDGNKESADKDGVGWIHLPEWMVIEDAVNVLSVWNGDTVVYRGEFMQRIEEGRRLWKEVELPRLARVLGRKEGVVERKYYDWLIARVVHGIVTVVNNGVVPHSGAEGPVEEGEINVCHTHLQNKSVTGLDLEWAPATVVDQVPIENQGSCWERVLLGYHEMIIAMGLVALEDYERIPTFRQLLRMVMASPGLVECPESFLPVVETYVGRKISRKDIKWIRKIPRTDNFLHEVLGRETEVREV